MSGDLSNRWWYAAGQSSQGPVSLARLQQLFAESRISGNTYVVDKVAIAIWTPISAVPNLLEHLKATIRDPNEPDTPPLPADVANQTPSKLDLSSIPKDKKKNKALSRRRHEDPRAWANRVDEYVHEDYYADISPRRGRGDDKGRGGDRNGASKKSSQDVRGDVSQSRRKKDVPKDDGDRQRRRPRWDDEDSDHGRDDDARDSQPTRRRKRRDDDYSSEDDKRRGSRRRGRRDDYSDSESSDRDRHSRRRKHRRRRDDSYSDSESDEPRRRRGKRKKDKKSDEDNDKSGDSRSESDEEPRQKKERKEKGRKGKDKSEKKKRKRKIHVEGMTSSEDDKEPAAPKKKSQDVRGSIKGPRPKPPAPEPNSEDEYSDPDARDPSEKPKKVGDSDEDEYEDPDEGKEKAKPAQRRKRKIIVEGLNDGPDGGPLGGGAGGAGGFRSSGQDARGPTGLARRGQDGRGQDPRDFVRGPDPGRRAPPGGMGIGMGVYGDEGGRGDMPGGRGPPMGGGFGRGPPMGRGQDARGPPGRGPPARGPMGGGFGRPPMGGGPMRGRGPPMGSVPEDSVGYGRPGQGQAGPAMTGQTESNIRVYDDGNIQLRTKRGSQDGRRRNGNPEDEYEDPDDDGDIGGGSLLERNSHLNFERGNTLQRERAWSYLRKEGRVGAPGSQQRRMMAKAILVEGQIPEEAAFQKMTDRGNFTDPTTEQMTYAPQKTGGGGGFGGGAPGDRPGDWTCGQCGTVNFGSRRECFGCGVQKAQADAQTVTA